ncbi:hypothetical protein KM043_002743 [Ampulex compressa]|nr:hypothetical protein KM043_002743 [Ampulex compressa]
MGDRIACRADTRGSATGITANKFSNLIGTATETVVADRSTTGLGRTLRRIIFVPQPCPIRTVNSAIPWKSRWFAMPVHPVNPGKGGFIVPLVMDSHDAVRHRRPVEELHRLKDSIEIFGQVALEDLEKTVTKGREGRSVSSLRRKKELVASSWRIKRGDRPKWTDTIRMKDETTSLPGPGTNGLRCTLAVRVFRLAVTLSDPRATGIYLSNFLANWLHGSWFRNSSTPVRRSTGSDKSEPLHASLFFPRAYHRITEQTRGITG